MRNAKQQLSGADIMKKRIIWIILLLLIVAGAAIYLMRGDDDHIAQYNSVARHILAAAAESSNKLPDEATTACGTPECKTVIAATESEKKDEETIKKEEIYNMFQADGRRNLVLNEVTRINIEKLYALNTPEELAEKMQKLSTVLPATAHRQVGNLVDYFDKYVRDVKQIYPPDVETETVEDSLAQLKGTHDLRLMHFGADVASAFFADEEKLSLQLLYLMSLEKDKNLSIADKAHKAQQLLQSNPELAAAYDPDRGSIKKDGDSKE